MLTLRLTALALMATQVPLAACGGSSTDGPPGSTTRLSGDAGPDPGSGPPALAAVALNKTSVSGCFNIATGTVSEPPEPQDYIAIIDPNIPPPGDVRVVDGDSGSRVVCEVSGLDFTINASIETSRLRFVVANGATSGGTGTATISEWDSVSQETLTGNNCSLNVKSLDPGAVWSQFSCPDFSTGTIQCRAEGAFVFENCRE